MDHLVGQKNDVTYTWRCSSQYLTFFKLYIEFPKHSMALNSMCNVVFGDWLRYIKKSDLLSVFR